MIEELIKYENDQLDSWYDTSVEYSDNFMKEFVLYADNNKNVVLNYALNSEPSLISSHNIIYEALSTFSTKWSIFLFSEIQRILKIVDTEPEKYRILEIISDSFYVYTMYNNDFILFENIINLLFDYYYNSKNKKLKDEISFVLRDLLTDAGEDHKTSRWWYQMDGIEAEQAEAHKNNNL